MLSTLAIAAPPQIKQVQDCFKVGDQPALWSCCNTGLMHISISVTTCNEDDILQTKPQHNWGQSSPSAPLAQSLPQPFFSTSGREQNSKKYLENYSKFLRCSLSHNFTESVRATNKNLGGWWYTVICILNRHSLSNSKFTQSPPRLEFEQFCFTNKSSIQQSSNHPGPEGSCLVIHKAIGSILKRIYRLFAFLTFIVFSN